MTRIVEQIAALERERSRLEGLLAADEDWRALASLCQANGSVPANAVGIEQKLRRTLAANPYYSARVKIVEAITILRRLGEPAPPATPLSPASKPVAASEQRAANGHDTAVEPKAPRSPLGLPLGVPLLGEGARNGRATPLFAPSSLPLPSRAETVSVASAATAPAADVPRPATSEDIESELTRIRGITPELARRLEALGTTCVEEIAAWTAFDVRRVTSAFNLGRRISKENWIEQAAVLARAKAAASPPAVEVRAAAPVPALAATKPVATEALTTPVAAEPLPAAESTAEPAAAVAAPAQEPSIPAAEPAGRSDAASVAGPAATPALQVAEETAPPATPASTEPVAAVPALAAANPSPDAAQAEPEVASPRDWLASRRGARAAAEVPPPAAAPSPIQTEPAPPRILPAEATIQSQPVTAEPAAAVPVSAAPTQQPEPHSDIRARLREARAARKEAAAEAEVTIVTPPEPLNGAPGGAATLKSLKKRLLGVPQPEQIDAATQAAYRGTVEEASVEIRRPGSDPAAAPIAQSAEPRLISRFLRALKGHQGEH